MGRQIQIAATLQDEHDFLGFVRKTADVAILGMFEQSKDDIWVGTFHPDLMGHSSYSIWNQAFPWTPEYGQTKAKGLFYISNTNTAPVIEFSRSDVPQRKYGRVYWAKDFSAPEGLDYDIRAFGRWFDRIVRWLRKEGYKDANDPCSPYFLPDAWETHRNAQQDAPADAKRPRR